MEKRYGIQELAELGGVSRRTVRYYVRRGLIPAPLGTGRGKHYSQAHLDALVRVRELQEQGVPLAEIELQHDPSSGETLPTPPGPAFEQTVWTRVELADGMELHLRSAHALDSQTLQQLKDAIEGVLGPD